MSDLPVVGYHAMRKELWDRQGANVPRPNKGILERDPHFFGVVLSQMDLGNVEMRKM